jgi:hypothetical protein
VIGSGRRTAMAIVSSAIVRGWMDDDREWWMMMGNERKHKCTYGGGGGCVCALFAVFLLLLFREIVGFLGCATLVYLLPFLFFFKKKGRADSVSGRDRSRWDGKDMIAH